MATEAPAHTQDNERRRERSRSREAPADRTHTWILTPDNRLMSVATATLGATPAPAADDTPAAQAGRRRRIAPRRYGDYVAVNSDDEDALFGERRRAASTELE